MARKKRRNRKPRPVAEVTHLMRLSNVVGWGEVDPSQVRDYGPDAWQPDEQFQRTNVFSDPRTYATGGGGPSTHPRGVVLGVDHEVADSDDLCYLLLIVPPGFEEHAEVECERLWGPVHEKLPGRIVVAINSMEDLCRVNSLRFCSGTRVMLVEFEDYVYEEFPDDEFLDYVKNEVQNLPWTGPYRAWATISGNAPVDPCSNPHNVVPKPSFRVRCTASDAPSWNEGVCRSFKQGIINSFGWEGNNISPDMNLLVEIQQGYVTIAIELTSNVISDPLSPPFKPFKDNVVTHVLAELAHLKSGESILNASCGVIDMSDELSKVQPNTISLFGDIHRVTVNDAKQNLGRWSRQGSDPDGVMVQLEALPIRDSIIDVLFAFLGPSKDLTDYQNSRVITRQLREIARVSRKVTGRVVLLTSMNEEWIHDVIISSRMWSQHRKIRTEFGELGCLLFVLKRSETSIPRTENPSIAASVGQGPSSRTSRGMRSNPTYYRRRLTPSQSPGSSRLASNTPKSMSDHMDWNTTF